jgi:hypothetical protein
MRRLRRRDHTQGLVEDRRRLVHRYLDGDEAPPPTADPPPPAEERQPQRETSAVVAPKASPPAPEPEPQTAARVAPRRPPRSQPLEPDAFDRAACTFEAVVRLCEQVTSLGAECERQREKLATAAARLSLH